MTLESAIQIISANAASGQVRAHAAASGMLASAVAAVPATSFFEDTRTVLNQLALAKAHLDIAAWHSPEVTAVTSQLLGRAQAFVSAETVPCTEWPTPAELVEIVRQAASEVHAA